MTSPPRECPHCHNPRTVVAEQRYRGLLRFCPMCDYSWVVGDADRDRGVREKGRHEAGPDERNQ